MRIVIDILVAAGFIFALAGTKGILKMPDAFCRMQASTCITTLGTLGVILGGALYAFFVMGSVATGVKVLLIGSCIDLDRCGLILGSSHSAGHKSSPDKLVKSELIP